MKISPISNNQPQFKAKLSKKEMNKVMSFALTQDIQAGIPKLYTLLERLDKMPGENAELREMKIRRVSEVTGYHTDSLNMNNYHLTIDNKLIAEGPNAYELLYSATTSVKNRDGKKIPMPKAVFDLLWWENREKTAQDIEQFFRE